MMTCQTSQEANLPIK